MTINCANMNVLSDTDRLEALYNSNILDTAVERDFDRITGIACRLLSVPVSLISLIDINRHFMKSRVGVPSSIIPTQEISLDYSLCQHVIEQRDVIAIPDTLLHPLSMENLATVELGVRSYIGAPIQSEGQTIGSICAVDFVVRDWSQEDQNTLLDLAHFAMLEIMQRKSAPKRRLA